MRVNYLFRSMLAIAGVFLATSCSQDELMNETSNADGFVTASFTVGTNDALATRAVGDGTTVDKVACAVYDAKGKRMEKLDQTLDVVDKKATYSIRLAKGQAYRAVFFAYNEAAAAYDVTNLESVKLNDNQLSNVEGRDAFTAYIDVTAEETMNAISKTVTLKRPFAQLNLGIDTEELEAAEAAGIVVEKSAIKVSNVSNAFNAYTNKVAEDAVAGEMAFALNTIPADPLKVTVDGQTKEYTYLALNYLLVGDANTEKALTDVEFVWENADASKTNNPTTQFINVPVQRNYRTNIIGRLITNPADFNLVVDEMFDGDVAEDPANALLLAANAGGEYTLSEDITLTAPLAVTAPFVLNLNGKTISGNFTDKYNEAVIDNSSTLKITGNGTIKNNAENGAPAINNSGELTLDDVTIEGAPIGNEDYPAYAVVSSGVLTIEEGTSISADRGCLKLAGEGKTVINGGTFTNKDITRSLTSHVVDIEDGGSNELTINGGTFQHLHVNTSGGVVICNRTSGTAYVNGGDFSGGNYYGNNNLSDYGYRGTFVVKGGTYSAKPADKYIAEGYKALESNGKYVVVPNTVGAVASSASEVSTAIAAGKAVMLVGDVTYSSAITNDAEINLNGNTFEATGTINLGNNADLTMTGGFYAVNSTYGHVDVRPTTAEGSVVVYEDVDFSFNKLSKTYGPSTNRLGSVVEVCAEAAGAHTKILFKNCTFDNAQVVFEGMSGKTGTFEAEFVNCTFNALTSSAPIYVQNYVEGTITLTGCTFNLECTSSSASAVSVSSSTSTAVTVTAENNTINAVAATPYTYDASKGETEEYNVKVNGTPKDIKFISIGGTTSTATETGTVKTGIAQ